MMPLYSIFSKSKINKSSIFRFLEVNSEYHIFILEIALNKTCTAGQPAGQCADSNAACDGTAFKCQCKSTHFVSKTGACKLGKIL